MGRKCLVVELDIAHKLRRTGGVARLRGEAQSIKAIRGVDVLARASGHEKLDNRHISHLRRQHERRDALLIGDVWSGAIVEQDLDCVAVSVAHGLVERGAPKQVGVVHGGADAQQIDNNIVGARGGGDVERNRAHAVLEGQEIGIKVKERGDHCCRRQARGLVHIGGVAALCVDFLHSARRLAEPLDNLLDAIVHDGIEQSFGFCDGDHGGKIGEIALGGIVLGGLLQIVARILGRVSAKQQICHCHCNCLAARMDRVENQSGLVVLEPRIDAVDPEAQELMHNVCGANNHGRVQRSGARRVLEMRVGAMLEQVVDDLGLGVHCRGHERRGGACRIREIDCGPGLMQCLDHGDMAVLACLDHCRGAIVGPVAVDASRNEILDL
eukprot:comp22101_c0_seq1/m.51371 comp22101_c0_seq1/g.51371  ORF comp22101_c0_seq1/g.51371 comp22101_c0_seq1/m.51371 type:complete len:383 (+) comp22101_c0_seq1:1082-2230(+)